MRKQLKYSLTSIQIAMETSASCTLTSGAFDLDTCSLVQYDDFIHQNTFGVMLIISGNNKDAGYIYKGRYHLLTCFAQKYCRGHNSLKSKKQEILGQKYYLELPEIRIIPLMQMIPL